MPISKTQEVDLISQARLGDSYALGQLIRGCYAKILAFVSSFKDLRPEHKDITQEAFLKAIENFDSFKGFSSFATWVKGIAFYLVKHRRRKLKNSPSLVPLYKQLPSFDKSPQEVLELNELKGLFEQFIHTLPAKEKQVLCARVLDNLSYNSICQQTEQNLAAAKKTYNRANHKWKRFIEENLWGEYG